MVTIRSIRVPDGFHFKIISSAPDELEPFSSGECRLTRANLDCIPDPRSEIVTMLGIRPGSDFEIVDDRGDLIVDPKKVMEEGKGEDPEGQGNF